MDNELQEILASQPKPVLQDINAEVSGENKQKLAAFLPDKRMIAGRKLHPYTMARKLVLQRSGNELLRLRYHAEKYAPTIGKQTVDELTDGEWLRSIEAIPDVMFHSVAFLFCLWEKLETVSQLAGKPEQFQQQVLVFADLIRGGERGLLPLVLEILVEASAGNDYEVADSGTQSPN